MNSWKTTRPSIAATVACLLCFSSAVAKKPGDTGGSRGDKGPSYRVIALDMRDGTGRVLTGNAFGINASRLIVGSVTDAEAEVPLAEAVCWTASKVDGQWESQIHSLDQGPFIQTAASDCNKSGEIVGNAYDGISPTAAYWADKSFPLEPLPSPLASSWAEEINNSGIVCGTARDGVGEYRALLWYLTEAGWKYVQLPPQGAPGLDENGAPLPHRSYTNAISDEEFGTGLITVVGWSNENAVAWTVILDDFGHPVVGSATILHPMGAATGVNNTGVVCGNALLGLSSGGDGVVWVNGGPAEPLAPTYSQWNNPRKGWPNDVNDDGLIVGYALFQACLWPNKDADPILLDDFLPKGKRATFRSLGNAYAVNKSGEIVGHGSIGENLPSPPFLAVPE